MLINGHGQHEKEFASKSISLLSGVLEISGAESQRSADPSFPRLPSLLSHCGFPPESTKGHGPAAH